MKIKGKEGINITILQKKINSLEDQISESYDMRKNKMLLEFNDSQYSSIKQIAVHYAFYVRKVINVC